MKERHKQRKRDFDSKGKRDKTRRRLGNQGKKESENVIEEKRMIGSKAK